MVVQGNPKSKCNIGDQNNERRKVHYTCKKAYDIMERIKQPKKINAMLYVTCQVKPTRFLEGMGYDTKKFAIECDTENECHCVCQDLSSMDGVNYIYIRKTKPGKECHILSSKENYGKELHL